MKRINDKSIEVLKMKRQKLKKKAAKNG